MAKSRIWRDQTQKRAVLEYLESRLLAHAGANDGDDDNEPVPYTDPNLTGGVTFATASTGMPLSSLPRLSSNSGAHAKLYLDFIGAAAQHWGGYNVTATHAFTLDSDATTFNATETDAITQIWKRVSEKYSPFNLDVTTIDPGTYTDGNALRVVIGGDASWYGSGAGGVGYVGSYANYGGYDLNTVYVFSDLYGSNFKGIAEAATHESGHAFGLQHQSTYDLNTHAKTAEYNPGNSSVAPIMGVSYYATRGLWSDGNNSNGFGVMQDDMATIADVTGGYSGSMSPNGFGYRGDDHGNNVNASDALARSGSTVSASGVIEQNGDADYFSFSTAGGSVSFTLSVAQYGAMLDAKLVLLTADGTVLSTADTSSFGETLSTTLSAGSYRIAVMGDGSYGDVGQYSLSGTVAPPDAPPAPSGLTASASGQNITLHWVDVNGETGYRIERSATGTDGWSVCATSGADSVAYTDSNLSAGTTYYYRLVALSSGGDSAYSTPAAAHTDDPATPHSFDNPNTTSLHAPTNLSAVVKGKNVLVTWLDNSSDETGFRIERSDDGGATWKVAGTQRRNKASFSDGKTAAGSTYVYRAVAVSKTEQATSDSASVTYAPASPNINARVFSGGVRVTWNDVRGETGYVVERSGGSTGWKTVGNVDAGVTSFADATVSNDTRYSYRVRAVNAGGRTVSRRVVRVKVSGVTPSHGDLPRSANVLTGYVDSGSAVFFDQSDERIIPTSHAA